MTDEERARHQEYLATFPRDAAGRHPVGVIVSGTCRCIDPPYTRSETIHLIYEGQKPVLHSHREWIVEGDGDE